MEPIQITQAMITQGSYTFDVSAEQFEIGTADKPADWYDEGNKVIISAVIEDSDGNETIGNESPTILIIDETPPVIANYNISSVISTGGTIVDGYWNSSNTGLDIGVTVQVVDTSVTNGSIRVLAGIGIDANSAAYEQLGEPVSVLPSNNIVDGIVSLPVTKVQVEAQTEYDEDRTINFKAEVVDLAGNKTEINISSSKLFIDTTLPVISKVESINLSDGSIKNGIFGIDSTINLKFTFSENLSLTSGTAKIGFDATIISTPEITSAELQNVSSIIVPYTVQESDASPRLTFSGFTLLPGNKLRDVAGNDMFVFTALAGSSLEDLSEVEVDGFAPSAFSVDTVYVEGLNTIPGYWNSNSTSIVIPINNPINDFNTGNGDTTLVGGNVQILGRVYNTDTNTPGQFIEIGTLLI